MADRRNPYLILGLDFGASPQQAQAAFARLSRRLRRQPEAEYRIEDATWALHEIEHAATDPGISLGVYRVPANPDAYTYHPVTGILAPGSENLPRRTGSSEAEVTGLRAQVAEELASSALAAAVDAFAADRVDTETDRQPDPESAPVADRQADPAAATVGAAAIAAPGRADSRSVRRYEPLAIALGNATLLGVGYLLLRRWRPALLTIATTAVLLSIVAGLGQPGWFWRALVVSWWVATVVHGWSLARRTEVESSASAAVESRRARRQWTVVVAATLVVLAATISTAVDARRIGAAAAEAHQAGDCDAATETLDRLGARHRVVDPYLTRRTGGDQAACELLLNARTQAPDDPRAAASTVERYLDHHGRRWDGAPELWADLMLAAAEAELEVALAGDTDSLSTGFEFLDEVLRAVPTRAEEVSTLLADFVGDLPSADPCDAKASVDWLAERDVSGDELDQASESAREIAPTVSLNCGDQLLDDDPHRALTAYDSLLDGYPDHELARDARRGVDAAETLIEAEHVQELISESRYCDDPAPFRGAPAYSGSGPHRLLMFGPDRFSDAVPSDWTAEDHTDTTLILCVDGPSDGSVLQTCQYERGTTLLGVYNVELRSHRYDVEAYELHTGELAFDTKVETGSGGCPPVLEWECSTLLPNCPPPSSIRASHSEGAIRSAVESWVSP